MTSQVPEDIKVVVDVVSFSTILATLAAWLPPMAALVSVIWGLIRIYETKTVQSIIQRRKVPTCNCKQQETI